MEKKQVGAPSEAEFNLPKLEEKVLAFWKSKHVFEKSLELRQATRNKKQGGTFVFYEGPPYANGKPAIHHVLARVVKDIILRYKSMAGYYVPRRAGWDTHGLPVEMATEKALGLKSKKEIEQIGVKVFNEKAKENVWLYKTEWENLTERIGYWLDLKNAYITYSSDYIESIWWTLKQIANRKLLYKGHKVVPWCVRCGTSLSSHELAQGYKETTDQSVYLKFKLRPDQKIKNLRIGDSVYILSWTTTPWTLPGNVALAVGGEIDYIGLKATSSSAEEIKQGDIFLLANNPDIFKKVFGESLIFGPRGAVVNFFGKGEVGLEKLGLWSGKELVGLEYEPLFNISSLSAEGGSASGGKNEHSHKIYAANFVTTTDGTGVVHTAVMYGEDDYKLGIKVGLPQHHTVDEEGRFTLEVPAGLAGCAAKPKDQGESRKTDEKIFAYLRERGNFLRVEPYSHEYPYCWRCDTPIIYYARDSWFIAMSKVRGKLLSQNKKINWIPDYVKEGRFGEWLREVKDWNLSRERYWGAPLPVWECAGCRATECIGSLDELDKKAGGSRNKYWIMRHGEAESNIFDTLDSGQKNFHLTPLGRKQVKASIQKFKRSLKKKKNHIDIVIASSIERTKETEEIVVKELGTKEFSFDSRVQEINLGSLTGCHDKRYHDLFPTYEARFEVRPDGGGESLRDLRKRISEFFKDVESKYEGKNILIVSHEYPIWMAFHVALGWNEKKAIQEKEKRGNEFARFAEIHPLQYKIIPRNDMGEVDIHRPYADGIKFPCGSCGGEMRRVKEVIDVWYDSGAMPFAQGHWPFSSRQGSRVKSQELPEAYPADFISEGMDQTRGWFYTLLAIATACGYDAPFKNVISLGLINDANGQKMSKSRGNIVDPWEVIGKYGVDAVRWYFYTVSPLGEPKSFNENDIAKTFRKFHLIIWNSLKFFETYKAVSGIKYQVSKAKNVLDQWVMARLDETILTTTKNLEKYDIRGAALVLETFVDDLSRWYIRRSRRRFQPARLSSGESGKPASVSDHAAASATLGFVLMELSKLLAPFTPFFAEIIYQNLGGKESIHLENWPSTGSRVKGRESRVLIEQMAEIRRLAALGLAARVAAGIKVRQPLARLRVSAKGGSASFRGSEDPSGSRTTGGKNQKSRVMSQELLAILADEVNVKEVVFDRKIKDEVELDTVITAELREEGIMRELVRMVQDLRQEARLEQRNKIALFLEISERAKFAIEKKEKIFMAEVGAKTIEYKKTLKFDAEIYSKFDGVDAWIGLRK